MKNIKIGSHLIGNNYPVFVIAEVGINHNGSFKLAKKMVDEAKKAGTDCIKFQTHIADAESSDFEPFRVNFSKQDETRQQYWKRTEFTIEQWMGLKKHCEDLNIEFISTPSSISAVDLLEKLNVARYKVGSGDTTNLLLLKRLGITKRKIKNPKIGISERTLKTINIAATPIAGPHLFFKFSLACFGRKITFF